MRDGSRAAKTVWTRLSLGRGPHPAEKEALSAEDADWVHGLK
jgi:hypothetical protein